MLLSGRVRDLKESDSFRLLAIAKELESRGREIIHLEIGEPDFDTAEFVKQAAYEGLKKGMTHYTYSQGLPELRRAIAEYEGRFRRLEVLPEDIVVAPGGKALLLFILIAILNPGDEVLVPSPGYLSYASLVSFAGGRPIFYNLRVEERDTIDPDEIRDKITRRTKAIIINTPSNPTGKMASATDMDEVLNIARDYKILVISDEVYSRIVYEKEHISITRFMSGTDRDLVAIVDSFSKTYAMTGWRLGWAVLPKVLVKPVVKIVQNSVSCVPGFVQYAGIVALERGEDFIKKMVSRFRERRDRVYEMLQDSERVYVYKPEGAFYFFPELDIKMKSVEFSRRLLEKYGVAVLPGSAFGPGGEGHVRISFANSMENLEKGIELFIKFLKEVK